MKLFSLFILITCFFRCSDKNCDVDISFKKRFDDCISLIKESEEGKVVYTSKKLDALIFLSVVTGHQTKINDPEYPMYRSRNDFKTDLRAWKHWFEENKCVVSLKKADSLLKAYHNREYKIKNFNW